MTGHARRGDNRRMVHGALQEAAHRGIGVTYVALDGTGRDVRRSRHRQARSA